MLTFRLTVEEVQRLISCLPDVHRKSCEDCPMWEPKLCKCFAASSSQYLLRLLTSLALFQLSNPLFQELPLWFLLGQRQSFLIRHPSLSGPAEPAVHICTGGVRQVIICQLAMFQHRVDMRQTGLWTIAHGNGHG